MEGVIVKGISGFYYVRSGGQTFECKAKGVFRKKGIVPLAGDKVVFSVNDDGSGTVDEILPRLNSFDRPPVANVEAFVLVAAVKDPEPSFLMLDRFTVASEMNKAKLIVCINKEDIGDEKTINDLRNAYAGIYPFFVISAKEGRGMDELKKELKGKQVALAGPSGVGKSTITNMLIGEGSAQTGEISQRLMRGKNTTRHTELFEGDGFFLFDTPGFTSFEAELEDEALLPRLFPEFDAHLGKCKFNDCRHINEPDCSVRLAVNNKEIPYTRYDSYKDIYKSIIDKKNKKYL